jgi:hypothetical protein
MNCILQDLADVRSGIAETFGDRRKDGMFFEPVRAPAIDPDQIAVVRLSHNNVPVSV